MRIVALAFALLASTSAMALEAPVPGKEDPRMQTITYSAGQIYFLHLVIGHTVAITLPTDEIHNDAYGSDSAHLKATPVAGTPIIFLKPIAVMPAKSLFIHAVLADGSSRLYPFQIDVVDQQGGSEDPYTLTIKDPVASAAAKNAAWKAWRAKEDAKAQQAALVAAAAATTDTNFKYVLQGKTTGDWNLLPTREVGDNGRETHWHFPGVEAHPQIYTVSPDGKEMVPDCSPNSETNITTCHQTAAQWRLRSGDSELCVYNLAFDPVGPPAPTNTSSPEFERTLRETSRQ
jgi:type IV secretion system protein VirB9